MLYEIVSKVLANRWKLVLPILTLEDHNAFVTGDSSQTMFSLLTVLCALHWDEEKEAHFYTQVRYDEILLWGRVDFSGIDDISLAFLGFLDCYDHEEHILYVFLS